MTKSEAIEKLKNMQLYMQIEDKNNDCKFTEDDYKANEMAIQALEKQIPKKPLAHQCTTCGSAVLPFDGSCCSNCGQKLDWSDEE